MSDFIYALDIGTRKVAGLVGRRTARGAEVLALEVREHRDRSMVDGQVHDVPAVAAVVREVTRALEEKVGCPLPEVALAAAGRSLRTARGTASMDHSPFEPVSARDVRFLERLALQNALRDSGAADRYHCVGYVPVQWRLDGTAVKSLEGHRGSKLELELLATFLPYMVLEGLLGVAQLAGLKAVCLTLEPIAALEAVVPPDLRQLNLALVDVGAGTSDIALVKGGSVTAFAMVPFAGDEVTESLCEHFVLDFQQAEKVKRALSSSDAPFAGGEDIFGHPLSIPRADGLRVTDLAVADLSRQVADRILELNQGSPAAVVLVGGGSATAGLSERLGLDLNLESRRLGVRKPDQSKDLEDRTGLLNEAWGVTPAGILLIAARNKGLVIQNVRLNGTAYSLLRLDESVSVFDLLAQAGVPVQPGGDQAGDSLDFTQNGQTRVVPGKAGRPAVLRVNGVESSLGDPLPPDAEVTFLPPEKGEPGFLTAGQLMAEAGDVACFLNGIPVVTRAQVSQGGRILAPDEPILPAARVETSLSTKLGEILESQGFEISGEVSRQILVSVNGDPRYLTQKNYLLKVNGREADFNHEVKSGDVVEFARNTQSHFRVRDVVTPPKDGPGLRLTVNGRAFELKGEPGRTYMNGSAVSPDEFVIDHATLVTREGQSAVGLVSHVLAQMEKPQPTASGQRLRLVVDGLEAGFTTPLKDGSSLLVGFE